MSNYQKTRETDKWAEYLYNGSRTPKVSRLNKYPVIGGPADGQNLTSVDIAEHPGYYPYNRAHIGPKQIWVFLGANAREKYR